MKAQMMQNLCERLRAKGIEVNADSVFDITHNGHGYVFNTRTNVEEVLRAKKSVEANGRPFTILNIAPDTLVKVDGNYDFADDTVDMIFFCLKFNHRLKQDV